MKLQKSNYYYQQRISTDGDDKDIKNPSISCFFENAIEEVSSHPPFNQYDMKRIKLEIAHTLINPDFIGGLIYTEIELGFIRKYYKSVYTARKMLKKWILLPDH